MEDWKLLIVTANSGGGGFKLNRILCCYEDVYWYRHENNGNHPWIYPENLNCQERFFAKNHFDRILLDGKIVPLIGERISCYWNDDSWIQNWYKLIDDLTLPKKYISIMVHDTPKKLREWFPDSFIVNLYDNEPHQSVNWHMKTSANYRINYQFLGQKPNYKNEYAKTLEYLYDCNPKSRRKDVWLYKKYGNISWNSDLEKEYYMYELNVITTSNNNRIDEMEYADINVSWETFDPFLLEKYFGALDKNYEKCFKSRNRM